MKKIVVFLGVILFFSISGFCQLERKGISLTVYNQNFALVSDMREGKVKKGKIILKFSDIASLIDPTTVSFTSLSYPDAINVMEQNFEYDLLNPDKLLNKYIDREIQVITKDGQIYRGKLLSYNKEQLIIKSKKEKNVSMVNRENIRDITFVEIPEDLILKPTLVLEIESKKVATHLFQLKYITDGVNWRADYVAELSPDDKKMDLTGWVTIDNRSGTAYKNAKLKLVAGEVRKVREYRRYEVMRKDKLAAAGFPQFVEKPFFEYHIYTLTRPTTLKNNQTKQIMFLSSSGIPVKKKYVYDGAVRRYYHYNNWKQLSYNDKVDVYIVFENKKENNLGVPLPKGKIRFYKEDTEGTTQFIGEDNIDHTPKNEKVELMIGKAFDIKGERKVIEHKKITSRIYEDTYMIKVRNHKDKSVKVEVIEHLYGDWEILKSSHKYEKIDASTIKFTVEVKPEKEVEITYTARYKF
ncbi:DUF4139 domain-containing protein [bacterium]|nr:DUF4139 domain-containing protein [bacterium]